MRPELSATSTISNALVASVASVYVGAEYKSLLQGVAVVAGYLVPGYLLKNAED